jgi:hypothetical protein
MTMTTTWTNEQLKEFEAWVGSRPAAGAMIDIETCELAWWYAQVIDPYGYHEAAGTFPEEADCVGRERFVRGADSDGWIWEGDLPPEKAKAMYARIERGWQAVARANLEDPIVKAASPEALGGAANQSSSDLIDAADHQLADAAKKGVKTLEAVWNELPPGVRKVLKIALERRHKPAALVADRAPSGQ